MQPSNRLYVGHIPAHVNEYALSKHFAAFGRVKKVDFLYHTHGTYKGRPRGYGFVEFERMVVGFDDSGLSAQLIQSDRTQ